MAVYELTVQLTRDGVVVPNFPMIRRLSVVEDAPSDLSLAPSGNVSLPLGSLSPLQLLTVRPIDFSVTAAVGTVTVNAGGLLLLFDGTFNQVTVTNLSSTLTDLVQSVGGGGS